MQTEFPTGIALEEFVRKYRRKFQAPDLLPAFFFNTPGGVGRRAARCPGHKSVANA
ncbi:conserved hypothetical protein [Pseudomonas protegens Pf-5]|uniref:Uncharacterized protein n=1 Tax=Pseudomonas fluorescens (strain ATCC BAA-477 / NRRL B-23932 / Pf-5) TaxID=220664 RepID=Q4K6P2_PSEF5|nr:conserved hypothetical protein [Pseudomonas protegens Pf-5]